MFEPALLARYMKLIPTKTQWNGWTLPSKATYIGCVIGIISLIVMLLFALLPSDNDKVTNQPQLALKFRGKPYLWYEQFGDSGLKFNCKLCIRNTGNNPAVKLAYKKVTQKLIVDDLTVATSNGIGEEHRPLERLVSGDSYCQRFGMSNPNLTSNQIDNCIKKYNAEQLSIILDIEIEYTDAITRRKYSIREKNKIYKRKVEILRYS